MNIEYIDFGAGQRPSRGYDYDAGIDVYLPVDVFIRPHQTLRIPLGFGLKLSDTYAGFVVMRSSYSLKGLQGSMAAIDSTYTGEISLIMQNTTEKNMFLKKGERPAALIVFPVQIFEFKDQISHRGNHGFGSTGRD